MCPMVERALVDTCSVEGHVGWGRNLDTSEKILCSLDGVEGTQARTFTLTARLLQLQTSKQAPTPSTNIHPKARIAKTTKDVSLKSQMAWGLRTAFPLSTRPWLVTWQVLVYDHRREPNEPAKDQLK